MPLNILVCALWNSVRWDMRQVTNPVVIIYIIIVFVDAVQNREILQRLSRSVAAATATTCDFLDKMPSLSLGSSVAGPPVTYMPPCCACRPRSLASILKMARTLELSNVQTSSIDKIAARDTPTSAIQRLRTNRLKFAPTYNEGSDVHIKSGSRPRVSCDGV